MTTKPEISFEATKSERALITKIINRAERLGMVDDRLSSTMDVTACHANGTPLDLQRWLDADDFGFAHDFSGILRHLDRATGQIDGQFLPRFSASAE